MQKCFRILAPGTSGGNLLGLGPILANQVAPRAPGNPPEQLSIGARLPLRGASRWTARLDTQPLPFQPNPIQDASFQPPSNSSPRFLIRAQDTLQRWDGAEKTSLLEASTQSPVCGCDAALSRP